VKNINPNSVSLKNVAAGSSATRKMIVIVQAVDAPGATCDPGEFSEPTSINLAMVDDDDQSIFYDGKIIACEGGGATANVKFDVFFQGPKNCENSAVPTGGNHPKSTGLATSTATGSAGTAPYVETTSIRCDA
jgi:hypothetical protein